jgi:hypothetical protein
MSWVSRQAAIPIHQSDSRVGSLSEFTKIPAETPHSTELELGNFHRTWMDSDRASALELLWGLLTSREILQPLKPHLSLSSLQKWTWEHDRGLNLTLFTLSVEESTMLFIGGVRRCYGQRLVCGAHLLGWPAMQLGWVAKFPPCTTFEHWIPWAPLLMDT